MPAGWAEGRSWTCPARAVGRSLGGTSLGTAAGRQRDLSPAAPSGCSYAGKANPGSPALLARFSELALGIGQLCGESRQLTNAPGNRPSNRLIAVRVKVNFGLVRVAARLMEGMGRQGTEKEELDQPSCSSVAESLMRGSGGNKTF